MFQQIDRFFIVQGLSDKASMNISVAVMVIFTVIVSFLAYFIAEKILLRILKAIISRSNTRWGDALLRQKFFERLVLIVPSFVIYGLSSSFPGGQDWIQRIAFCMIVIGVVLALDRFLNAVNDIYNNYDISDTRPIKGYLQVAKIIVYTIGLVLIVSELTGRSPWFLLGSIGAATAVLLLIFQNSILGFVASIQLTENDMVRIGDWIEMPAHGADGTVREISLHTVKVQNWDNTITTVPTYAMVSESFKNWRNMQEAGGRRIQRAIHIDMNSIRFCDEGMLERYERIQIIGEHVAEKARNVSSYNTDNNIDASSAVNGRHLTNLGIFRAYAETYIKNHPKIKKSMTRMVRQLDPDEHGLPIEIYAFTDTTAWEEYETIQSDIFDHMLAVLPEFDLRIFQSPSGHDLGDGCRTD